MIRALKQIATHLPMRFSGGAYIPNDSRAIVADPLFVSPQVDATKTVLTDILAGFKLQSGSPLIDAGMPVPQNEGIYSDFLWECTKLHRR